MKPDYRIFQCARCLAQVAICSWCDCGQRYCTASCSRLALRDNQREASRRYQSTPRGARFHAARQARYRALHSGHDAMPVCASVAAAQKVTHQGSLPAADRRTLRRTSVVRRSRCGEPCAVVLCSFCGEPCEPYARRDFLRRRR